MIKVRLCGDMFGEISVYVSPTQHSLWHPRVHTDPQTKMKKSVQAVFGIYEIQFIMYDMNFVDGTL